MLFVEHARKNEFVSIGINLMENICNFTTEMSISKNRTEMINMMQCKYMAQEPDKKRGKEPNLKPCQCQTSIVTVLPSFKISILIVEELFLYIDNIIIIKLFI